MFKKYPLLDFAGRGPTELYGCSFGFKLEKKEEVVIPFIIGSPKQLCKSSLKTARHMIEKRLIPPSTLSLPGILIQN